MSEQSTPTNEVPVVRPPLTEPVAAVGARGAAPQPTAAAAAGYPADGSDTSGDDPWPTRGPRRGVRLRVPTAILLVLLIAMGGIWGGAALQRHETASSGSTGASSFAAAFAGLRSGGTFHFPGSSTSGAAGTGFAGRTVTSAAAGTVTDVQGDTLWVTTATGSLVKVELGSTTTYTRNAKSTASALRPGDTVIVQGSKAKDGTVAASSVASTEEGVTSATGFGG